jgi:bile acid-coenzyme A ligase
MTGSQSFSRVISARAAADPDAAVVVDAAGALTAAELDVRSNRLARAVLASGVRRNDLVAISLPNTVEFVVAAAAVWKAGATPHPVSPQLPSGERAELERLGRPALAIGAAPTLKSIPHLPAGFSPRQSGAELPDTWADSWKAPTSSGSTGRPKIVKANAPALADPAQRVAPFLPLHAVQLVTSPLWHSAAFTYAFRGLMTGHRLVLAETFDEHRFCELVDRHQVTWTLLSPNMIHRLLRVGDLSPVPTLTTVLHMGARCAPEDKRALIDWLGPDRVTEVYAGSESNGLTMITGSEWLQRPGSVGRPLSGTEIRIEHADGSKASCGEVGHIWLRRGEQPAYTYLGGTSRRTAEGWDTLGDLGSVDEHGYLTVVDRADDAVVLAGHTIYPSRVEHAIEAHPAVRSAVVFADGDRIAAVAETSDGASADDIRRFAAARLTPAETPSRIHLTRTPVRDDAGKVRRSTFRSRFAETA